MSAADERVGLMRLIPTLTDPVEAVTALVIVHARLADPSNSAGWICGCLHQGRIGEMHARHAAQAIVNHLNGRT